MSLLLGTIKSKLGFLRQFKDMSLDELDFTSKEVDYMLEDIDDDESYMNGCSEVSANSKKRARDAKGAGCENRDIKREKVEETELIPEKKEDDFLHFFGDLKPQLVEMLPPMDDQNASSSSQVEKADLAKQSEKDSMPSFFLSKEPSLEQQTASESQLGCDDKKDNFFTLYQNSPEEVSADEVLKCLENIYLEERGIVVRGDGFICTPLHAMKQLALKYQETIHNEVIYVPIERQSRPLVRVEVFVGVFRGVGESFYKRMAAQMAAIDLLIKVKNTDAKCPIVTFAMFPGWRVRTGVFQDLLLFCQKNGLKVPRYITKSNISDPEKPVCLVECYIGNELIGSGESDLAFVARKLAAYNAIQAATGETYPLEYVTFGSGCLTFGELLECGVNPCPSDFKKEWMLEETGLSNEARGLENEELEALHQIIYEKELKEIAGEKTEFKITVSAGDSSESSQRKVNIKQDTA